MSTTVKDVTLLVDTKEKEGFKFVVKAIDFLIEYLLECVMPAELGIFSPIFEQNFIYCCFSFEILKGNVSKLILQVTNA